MTGRDCPFRCSYCTNNALHKIYKHGFVRRRNIENIISELKQAKVEYHPKRIEFLDEAIFYGDLNYSRNFLKEYRRQINLPIFITTHCSFLNEEICRLLKESNCIYITLGLQSAEEDYRRKILHRLESNRDYINASSLLKKYKIPFSFDHIFNMPFEDETSYRKAIFFYNRLRPDFISTFQLQYFPKTDITKLALEEGILKKDDIDNICDGIGPTRISVGIGGKDVINDISRYQNYQFWMHIMPFIPQRLFLKAFKRLEAWPKKIPSVVLILLRFIAMIKVRLGFLMWYQIIFHIKGVWYYYKKVFSKKKL